MGRQLPKYDEYLERLMRYCEATELPLEYKEYDNDGAYVPSARKIIIDRDLDESTEIATIAHEIGHSIDDALKDPKTLKKYDKAYTAFYKNEATEKQRKIVLACEKKAWEYGRAICKKLRIKCGKWYDDEEAGALKDYGQEEQSGS